MQYRTFGRTNWPVSEIGYGMWGLAGWTGTDVDEVNTALQRSVELGCTFFDTAWGYSKGKSEEILGQLVRQNSDKQLYMATKIPPKNFKWPSKAHFTLEECFPYEHIIKYTEKSLRNLNTDCIGLQQFHVWEDAWADNDDWKEAIYQLQKDGKVQHFGISVNRWEPDNVLNTLRTDMIAAVQVIYNIFDQAPEDNLFPLCREMNIGVIARVPFDEGSLTGLLTKDTVFPADDWRSTYFVPENLKSSVEHADALKPLVPAGSNMPDMALRFILANQDVHTIIPGMRKVRHVEANIGSSDGKTLSAALLEELKQHRWDRVPTAWSQ